MKNLLKKSLASTLSLISVMSVMPGVSANNDSPESTKEKVKNAAVATAVAALPFALIGATVLVTKYMDRLPKDKLVGNKVTSKDEKDNIKKFIEEPDAEQSLKDLKEANESLELSFKELKNEKSMVICLKVLGKSYYLSQILGVDGQYEKLEKEFKHKEMKSHAKVGKMCRVLLKYSDRVYIFADGCKEIHGEEFKKYVFRQAQFSEEVYKFMEEKNIELTSEEIEHRKEIKNFIDAAGIDFEKEDEKNDKTEKTDEILSVDVVDINELEGNTIKPIDDKANTVKDENEDKKNEEKPLVEITTEEKIVVKDRKETPKTKEEEYTDDDILNCYNAVIKSLSKLDFKSGYEVIVQKGVLNDIDDLHSKNKDFLVTFKLVFGDKLKFTSFNLFSPFDYSRRGGRIIGSLRGFCSSYIKGKITIFDNDLNIDKYFRENCLGKNSDVKVQFMDFLISFDKLREVTEKVSKSTGESEEVVLKRVLSK